jgi:mRNA interferase RelE/StbE
MKMRVIYSAGASKDLRRLPVWDQEQIVFKMDHYAETGKGDIKKLQGRAGYRLRHGVWRANFVIEGDVIVVSILHRGAAYQ